MFNVKRKEIRARDVPREVILSHRLKGFTPYEASIESLNVACEYNVKQIEIDTRITADGTVIVFHDAYFDNIMDRKGFASNYNFKDQKRPAFLKNQNIKLPTLEEFLDAFSKVKREDTLLHIDLKDFGEEQKHVELIKKYKLEQNTIIVSWWPESLKRIHSLAPSLPLAFSYIPLTGVARLAKAVKKTIKDNLLHPFLRAILKLFLPRTRKATRHLLFYFNQEDNDPETVSLSKAKGFYPLHFVDELPKGEILNCLLRSKGAVNIPIKSLTENLVKKIRDCGLKMGVFSAKSAGQLTDVYFRFHPDFIYFDKGEEIDMLGPWIKRI